jgi:cytochrome P450
MSAAIHRDPYPSYAELTARRPFGRDEDTGRWVAAGAAAVSEVLDSPACLVRPLTQPVPPAMVGTPAGEVFGRLVRMTDGPAQARRKRVLLAALGTLDPGQVRALAVAETERAVDWPDVQFGVPTRVMARLLGIEVSAEVPGLIGEFVRCIPASATAQDYAAASSAAARLLDLLAPGHRTDPIGDVLRDAAGHDPEELAAATANQLGLLSQTYEAMAGLIGTTLLALAREPRPDDIEAFVGEVARHDAPIQNTRRSTASECRIAGQVVPAGTEILVLLAAANRDPLANPDPHVFRVDRAAPQLFTFGRAAHRCPGRALATAITAGVVDAASGSPDYTGYRASPNARIPVLAEWSA